MSVSRARTAAETAQTAEVIYDTAAVATLSDAAPSLPPADAPGAAAPRSSAP